MAKNIPIENISDTAFWVAHYRVKESERSDALFRDPLAKKLAGDHGKNISESMAATSRFTEWSVISRTIIIDRFINDLLNEGVDAVINLGAGLDTRPYRMNLPQTLEWIEADHPRIIAYKEETLRSEQPKCKLTRIAVDLTDSEKRRAFLGNVAPKAKKVLVLTEGVIPYLTLEQVGDLAGDLTAQKRFGYWITEYFHPKVYRSLKRALKALDGKNLAFQFFPDDWYGFFRNKGWIESKTCYAGDIALEFNRKQPLPKWVEFIFRFLPQKIQDEARQMTGFVLFKRG